jgi:hypothetical protein
LSIQELSQALQIRRIVVWGLHTVFNHSHHFIHGGFYLTLKKLGVSVIWVDDAPENIKVIMPGDFVIAVNVFMKYLPVVKGAKYCLHNANDEFLGALEPDDCVRLQVFNKGSIPTEEQKKQGVNPLFSGVAYYDSGINTLYQSWGAPLLAKEFYKPMRLEYRKSEYFVGTIWDNELGQGNSKVIPVYQNALQKFGVRFIHVQGAPELINPLYVRHAAVGASIVGNWQREIGYAPCRLFKAVSFGRPGLINADAISLAYPWAICNENIPELIDYSFGLNANQTEELVHYQQSFVAQETYEKKIGNMLHVLLFNQLK